MNFLGVKSLLELEVKSLYVIFPQNGTKSFSLNEIVHVEVSEYIDDNSSKIPLLYLLFFVFFEISTPNKQKILSFSEIYDYLHFIN